MGHISGKIADITLANPATIRDHDFIFDDGSFVRRRFTLSPAVQQANELLNISFWADNPPFFDPSHKSGLLSVVWLALTFPALGRRLLSEGVRLSHIGPRPHRFFGHFKNVFCSPYETTTGIFRILFDRYMTNPRKPGFLVRNRVGRYALHYHAEQLPRTASRVYLSNECDMLGVPRLSIELQHDEADACSIVCGHEVLDAALRAADLGRLEYRVPEKERLQSVLDQASDGFHQIGTVRMGNSIRDSVVDPDCKIHGLGNLFVASTCVFPSSGQANPTFLAVVLAIRLADHLKARRSTQKIT
jgi:hypothetical protein